ncbi:MAG: hypothetical protein ACJASB_001668 [Shewanella psychromarinicola]|jgi:hypothetical protein
MKKAHQKMRKIHKQTRYGDFYYQANLLTFERYPLAHCRLEVSKSLI